MMEENTNTPTINKRPKFLSVLCILTFIGSGLSLLLYLFASIFMLVDYEKFLYFGDTIPYWNLQLNGAKSYFILNLLFFTLSFISAVLMLKLKRIGFWLYILAQVVLLVLPVMMLPSDGLPWGPIFFTTIFIGLYLINFKHLK